MSEVPGREKKGENQHQSILFKRVLFAEGNFMFREFQRRKKKLRQEWLELHKFDDSLKLRINCLYFKANHHTVQTLAINNQQ